MARIYGSVRYQSPIRMRQERRDRELAALFGREVVQGARDTDPMALELTAERMDAVHDAADELLANSGDALAQRRTINSLDAETRLTLCMWVMDMEMAARLAARAIRDDMRVCG